MNRIRTRVRRSAISAWCVVAVGLVGAQSSNPAHPAKPATSATPRAASASVLIPGGEPPDLFLLYTGDVIGYIDPCG